MIKFLLAMSLCCPLASSLSSSSSIGSSPSSSKPSSLLEQNLQSLYDADMAQDYNSMMKDEMSKIIPDLQQLIQDTHLKPGKIVDVCCGTGDLLLWLSQQFKTTSSMMELDDPTSSSTTATTTDAAAATATTAYSFHGVDISPHMLNVAKEKDVDNILLLEQGDMRDLSKLGIRDDSCSAVLCNFSLHHYSNCDQILTECVRVLKPITGILYLSFYAYPTCFEQDVPSSLPTYYHKESTIETVLISQLDMEILMKRANREDYPGIVNNEVFMLARKKARALA